MAQVRVLVLRAPGTNCDVETVHAFERVGAAVRRVHINEALARRLADCQILVIPGGFSYGDDIAAGKIFATQLRLRLSELVLGLRDADNLVLGICNGFQVLIKAGLLPGWEDFDPPHPPVTLAFNDSGKFEDRWVRLAVRDGKCPFLRGLSRLDVPVAHAEGKFVCRDDLVLARLLDSGQACLRYEAGSGGTDRELATRSTPYPANPNGSQADIAGICDPTGRILGLMPHPERFILPTQHPRWTRYEQLPEPQGLRIFQNAVAFFS